MKGAQPQQLVDRRRRSAATLPRMTVPGRVSQLLRARGDGDAATLDDPLPLIERELRRRARHDMAQKRRGHTIQVTALGKKPSFASPARSM